MIENFVRKIALPTTIVFFCALIGLSAYQTSKNMKVIEGNVAQRIAVSEVQSDIVDVATDLQNIETGQRGYLLTGNESYLEPYTTAVKKLPAHLSTLRSRLADRPAKERALENDLEAVAKDKIADAQETIGLRQKGYRHRAFLIVDSNRGKILMDKAQTLLDSLSATEAGTVAENQRQLTGSVSTALKQAAMASGILLLVTVLTLIAFDFSNRRLRVAYAREQKSFRATREQLERLTATLSTSVRATLAQMQSDAESLLSRHGGFLPRQGQEKAESIYQGSWHINRVLGSLLEPTAPAEADEDMHSAGDDTFAMEQAQRVEAVPESDFPDQQSA